MRTYYKVRATYGHCGHGKGVEIDIPIFAKDIFHAIKRAQKMGGVKKKFSRFLLAQEIDGTDYLIIRNTWVKFKMRMKNTKRSRRKAAV